MQFSAQVNLFDGFEAEVDEYNEPKRDCEVNPEVLYVKPLPDIHVLYLHDPELGGLGVDHVFTETLHCELSNSYGVQVQHYAVSEKRVAVSLFLHNWVEGNKKKAHSELDITFLCAKQVVVTQNDENRNCCELHT